MTAGSARVPDSSVLAEAARRGRLDAATGARTGLHSRRVDGKVASRNMTFVPCKKAK